MNYEQAYDELLAKYTMLVDMHRVLQQNHDSWKSACEKVSEYQLRLETSYNLLVQKHNSTKQYAENVRAEIRALHRKLRDANRGAERLHLINAQLRIELVEYKLKHPENTEVEIFKGTVKCGVDLAQGLDQTVTYIYDGKAHTAKIQQQQNDGAK